MRTTPRRTKSLAKAFIWLLAAVYTALVVYIVFFARRRRGLVWTSDLVNLVPVLHTIRDHRYIASIGWWNYWDNIFGNVILFMPMPTLVASVTGLRSRRVLLATGVAVSVFIEVTQFVLRIGVPDIDDVILNSTGALLGVVLWELIFRKILRQLAVPNSRPVLSSQRSER